MVRPPRRTGARQRARHRRGEPGEPGDPALDLGREAAAACSPRIDRTVTGAGARELAARLSSPLTDPHAINARLDAVGFLIEREALREDLRAALKAAPDIARALSRLALQRGGPRDLGAVRDALAQAHVVRGAARGRGARRSACRRSWPARSRASAAPARSCAASSPQRSSRSRRTCAATAASCAPGFRPSSTRRGGSPTTAAR